MIHAWCSLAVIVFPSLLLSRAQGNATVRAFNPCIMALICSSIINESTHVLFSVLYSSKLELNASWAVRGEEPASPVLTGEPRPQGPHTDSSGIHLPYIVCPLIIPGLIHHYMAGTPSGTGRSLRTEDRTSSSKGLICAVILRLIDGRTLINVSSPLSSGGGFWWSVKTSNFLSTR